MKVAVDARMLKMSGIGTYIQNLMKRNCYNIALGNEQDLKEYKNHLTDIIEFTSPIYGIKEQFKFPYKKLKKLKPDILHVPHYNIPIFYRGKMIVTIHDLTHLILPEFLPNKFAKFYAKFMLRLALKKSVKVLVVSENTKNDILKMFKVSPDKIEVIYNGVGKEFQKKKKSEINYLYQKYNISKNKKLLMYVGNMKPHKNLKRLLEAFSNLDNIENYQLILVGKAFQNQLDLKTIEQELNISSHVIHTGMVNQQELVDLYNLADLFIFPSLYEGFGIPILEAIACGTNVIASNISSIPEVGGKYIEYFEPYNVEDIKQAIVNNINKPLNKDAHKLLDKFNWDDMAEKVHNILSII